MVSPSSSTDGERVRAVEPSAWLRIAPALAALIYPVLVWSGPALWKPLVATALVVPAFATWALLSSQGGAAGGVALAAVAAPPIFTLLGGLLDFQRAIPLSGNHVWIALWIVLAAVAARAPSTAPVALPRTRRLAVAHGIAALPVIAFGLAHVVNHLGGVVSVAAHIAIASALRTVYRNPVVEAVLFACIAFQIVSGFALVARRLRRGGPIAVPEALQLASGAYIAMFLCSHVTAILRARGRGSDTNWTWLLKYDVFADPWSARLGPYYFLSIVAFALHLACAIRVVAAGHHLRWFDGPRWIAFATGLGALAAAAIIAALQR